jgi:hypothetical protein
MIGRMAIFLGAISAEGERGDGGNEVRGDR